MANRRPKLSVIEDFIELTKPRMTLSNVIVAAAAFAYGSHGPFNIGDFALLCVGLGLTVASGCALNNYFDRYIDSRMERTKLRALPAGRLRPAQALWWGAALFVLGAAVLMPLPPLAALSALAGFVSYVFVYTPLKPRTGLALFAGAFSGAMPPVVGYVAAGNGLDWVALILFAALYLWQIPHFLAISVYRYDEYTAAGVPLLVGAPGPRARRMARATFYASLIILLAFCVALILQR